MDPRGYMPDDNNHAFCYEILDVGVARNILFFSACLCGQFNSPGIKNRKVDHVSLINCRYHFVFNNNFKGEPAGAKGKIAHLLYWLCYYPATSIHIQQCVW